MVSVYLFPVYGQEILVPLYALKFFVETGHFEYYSVVTLEIRFFPSPRVCCWLLRAEVVHLFSNLLKLVLLRLYSLLYMVTDVSITLSHR